MAIGQHTFWIIVSIPDGKALTSEEDKRTALRFTTREAAQSWCEHQLEDYDPTFEIVVEVPA